MPPPDKTSNRYNRAIAKDWSPLRVRSLLDSVFAGLIANLITAGVVALVAFLTAKSDQVLAVGRLALTAFGVLLAVGIAWIVLGSIAFEVFDRLMARRYGEA